MQKDDRNLTHGMVFVRGVTPRSTKWDRQVDVHDGIGGQTLSSILPCSRLNWGPA